MPQKGRRSVHWRADTESRMPKEITHWLIAENAAALLKGSRLERAVTANPQCLRLGAVFPDVLFFLVGKSPLARLGEMGCALHGRDGEDTYAVLRSFPAGRVEKSEAEPLKAFWAGIACHLRSDIVFHPLVYYLTGNYHRREPRLRSRAVQRHRRFETLMDMYFNRTEAGGKTRKHSLKDIVNRLEIPLPRLFEIASRSLAEVSGKKATEIEKGLHRGLKIFMFMQGLYGRPVLSRTLFSIEKRLPDPIREITALFEAPKLTVHFNKLTAPIRYLHPVTGEPAVTTVDDLFRRAGADCADFCTRLEDSVFQGAALVERGPSLSFALPGAKTEDAGFFSDGDFLS